MFFEVNKDSPGKSSFIKIASYLFSDTEKGMVGWIFFPETELKLVDDIIIIQKLLQFVLKNELKDFTDIWQKRNWAIVFTFSLVAFFENWANQSRLYQCWEDPFPERFIDDAD